jgi:hypothetical protein
VSKRPVLGLALAALALSSPLAGSSRSALASASLAREAAQAAAALPKVERALLVFDAKSGREELVWSFEPRDPSSASVQIVPVPSKPEVSALDADALDALIERHPPFSSNGQVLPSATAKPPSGAPRAAASPTAKLGWKVFAPTELEALRTHLDEQQHPVDASTSGWLERLALRGFHFVAILRPARTAETRPADAPAASASAAPSSSTRPGRAALLRIRFVTPAPYFPYSEPALPSSAGLGRGRSLNVWSITSEARSPLAVYREEARRHWVRPWRETAKESVQRAELVGALGPALASSLPRDVETWVVQRFVDQKSKRDGFGDVLLVPSAAPAPAPTDETLARAVGLLDAELEVTR